MIQAPPRAALCRAVVGGVLVAAMLAGCSKREETTGSTAPSRNVAPSNVHPEIWPQVSLPALDDTAIEPRGKPVQFLRRHQAPPDVIIGDVGQPPLVEGVVSDSERLPGLTIIFAKRRDLDHARL